MKKTHVTGIVLGACLVISGAVPAIAHTTAEHHKGQDATVTAGKKASKQWKGYGVTVKRDSLGLITVDGKPAAQGEVTEKATTYQQGLFTVILYNSGKVALMNQGQFVGYLK